MVNTVVKEVTVERVSRIILTLLSGPNQSAKRAGLWRKLVDLRGSLEDNLSTN